MATSFSTSALPLDRTARTPGIHVEDRLLADLPPRAAMSGVPVFIGFAGIRPGAAQRGRTPAVVISRWDARAFDEAIAPAPRSFLRRAVRGFFANGGQRCVVMAAPEPQQGGPTGADALLQLLAENGPLEDRSDIDLVCIPDAVSPLVTGDDALQALHRAALAHCEAMGDRFAILDAPPSRSRGAGPAADADVDAVLRWSSSIRSAFGALYFPWLATDPERDAERPVQALPGREQWRCAAGPDAAPANVQTTRSRDGAQPHFVPPCGHVAGLYARIDARVGAQWSPANELLDGVSDVALHLGASQRALLNEGGVNCLRSRAGRGIEVSGARTLSGHALWAHVSSARVILGFRRWLVWGLRDLVFEPNTPMLWDLIRIRIVAHCLELQSAGALAGSAAEQAFFVKCDAETNPPEDRQLGRVVAQVGLAPSVPAEFIVVRVVHDASGFTVSGLS